MKGDETFFRLMIAHRVLAIRPGFSRAERLVGAALLGHYNAKSARCDPAVGLLAKELGLKRDTVFAAIKGLIGAGLFERRSHGGRRHANAYLPIWPAFLKMNNSPSAGDVKEFNRPPRGAPNRPL